jgi:serine/threonine protein kinase
MKNWFSQIFGGANKAQTPPRDVESMQAIQNSVDKSKNAEHAHIEKYGASKQARASQNIGDWNPGQVLMDDFIVEQTLGEGGMGKVYLLRSKSTGSQFAVKRAKGLEADQRKKFLAELQTWIDLPEHANLVPCRFFRTLGDEVLIFAEYVEGGSLQAWIASRKLYAGGQRQALERILDVAIQFAWGLHCLHELGLVHQDVKPGNVLMGADQKSAVHGVKPMVTDYGLARARAAAAERHVPELARNVLVSCGGGTPAYWSPEQAQGVPLTQKTDIWSWGLSVLEMFIGDANWMSGQAAGEALEQCMQNGGDDEAIPAMPAGVADLLRDCFRHDPVERLGSLAEAVERLKAIFDKNTGSCYSRVLSVIKQVASPQADIKERRIYQGTEWTDPQKWLEKALRAAGRDPTEAAAIVSRRGTTRRGELVAEIAVYDEAKRLYERLVMDGRKEFENDLARLCIYKAFVHETATDGTGALHEYDQAIAILEQLVNRGGRRELANDLANVYMNKGVSIRALGNDSGAVALYDQAIAILERLINQEGRQELANDLARVYTNKATSVSVIEGNLGAVPLYDQAIAIIERLVIQEGRRYLANDLARIYTNKAIAVSELGDNLGAVPLYDQAIAIRERLVIQEGRRELAYDLARVYRDKATSLSVLGDKRAAVALFDQAITIQERLVNQEGRSELVYDLASVYTNKADTISALGDYRGALTLYDQAIAIRKRLVNQEGRRELAGDLAWVVGLRAVLLVNLGEARRGRQEARAAMNLLRTEVERTGRADLKSVLNWIAGQVGEND